ncbi:hypothetical protein DFA_11385 [Cavenderia fasciculata]|uniref:Uncharacterized protein n=1 Tax=Cavenderia fasciculata TaxID=261658 RepID=F4QCP2_CACFS|nr:uncharacterized protein DFA_11385 [Cavenderia fasciculata]EGG13624.1 hypothetical protein DFA_11385 [Cavenderia fasciculata]|eukprot:XP_004350328.1 hypothetical protein DFA_11385 [Cavenderia fasciculata]
MAIAENYNLHLDIGGEGHSAKDNSGFDLAINVNISTETTFEVVGENGFPDHEPFPTTLSLLIGQRAFLTAIRPSITSLSKA